MAFTEQDGTALERATQAGFEPLSMNSGDREWPVYRFSCIAHPQCTNAAETLAEAIEAADRWEPRTTVWLDVPASSVPSYVLAAIEKVGSYPTAVVVTLDGLCTYGPNAGLIDPALQAMLARCNRGGGKWHPILNQVVISGSQTEPHTARTAG